jgi:hypothetical protein
VIHCLQNNLFTAESQRAQSEFSFSFAAETPANENPHAFGYLSTFEFCPSGREFIPFRPPCPPKKDQRKGIKQFPLRTLRLE